MQKKIGIKKFIIGSLFAIILIYAATLAAGLTRWFDFKGKNALNDWEEKIFKGRVLYAVKVSRKHGYLSAYSNNAASGIFYRLSFDPKNEPWVSWKWRVLQFPDKSKGEFASSSWIEKDDYAARFYIIFPRLSFTLTKSLEYVWDKTLPKGTIIESPYFKNIKLIVAESGDKNMGQWVYEERNIREDFKKAFGREPGNVGAIAIMTDSDNTLSTAEANYAEIKVGYKKWKTKTEEKRSFWERLFKSNY